MQHLPGCFEVAGVEVDQTRDLCDPGNAALCVRVEGDALGQAE